MSEKKDMDDKINEEIFKATYADDLDLNIPDDDESTNNIINSLGAKQLNKFNIKSISIVLTTFCLLICTIAIIFPMSSLEDIQDNTDTIVNNVSRDELYNEYPNLFIPDGEEEYFTCFLYKGKQDDENKYICIDYGYDLSWREYILIEYDYCFDDYNNFENLSIVIQIENYSISYKIINDCIFFSFESEYQYYFWVDSNDINDINRLLYSLL